MGDFNTNIANLERRISWRFKLGVISHWVLSEAMTLHEIAQGVKVDPGRKALQDWHSKTGEGVEPVKEAEMGLVVSWRKPRRVQGAVSQVKKCSRE